MYECICIEPFCRFYHTVFFSLTLYHILSCSLKFSFYPHIFYPRHFQWIFYVTGAPNIGNVLKVFTSIVAREQASKRASFMYTQNMQHNYTHR